MYAANKVTAAERSRTRIVQAFMTLLCIVPYEEISISRLCRETDVFPRTFHRSFKNIDAIVQYKLQQIQLYYNEQVSFSAGKHPRFSIFYSYIQSNKAYEPLLQRRFASLFEKQVKEIYKNDLTIYEGERPEDFFQDHLSDYVAAIVVLLTEKWVECGYKESPEQLAAITEKLIMEYIRVQSQTSMGGSLSIEGKNYRIQHLADILDNIPIGVCVLFMPDERHQELRFANKQMMRMINPTMAAPEKVAPKSSKLRDGYYKNAFSGVHPDDYAMAIAAFRKGFHLKQFRVNPIQLMTSTGNYIWVVVDVTHREDLPGGRLFYASYRDVSREMQLHQELEEQERHLREALDIRLIRQMRPNPFSCPV